MTPQQYDAINGLNALGGCLGFLCIFGVFPVVFVLSGSFLLGIFAMIACFIGSAVWVGNLKKLV